MKIEDKIKNVGLRRDLKKSFVEYWSDYKGFNSVGLIEESLAAEIFHTYKKQKQNLQQLKESTAQERISKLRKLQKSILKYKDDIAEFKFQDQNAGMIVQNFPVMLIGEAEFIIKRLKRWMKPEKVSNTLLTFGQRAYKINEPRGICLLITPWNFPIYLSFRKIFYAVAAGNAFIIKPDSRTLQCAKIIKKIISENFEDNEGACFIGHRGLGNFLTSLPFDYISFTGSSKIGSLIKEKTAKMFTPVSLELGGKCPVVIDKESDFKHSVKKIISTKLALCGQICLNADYVLVHSSQYKQFINESKLQVERILGKTVEDQKKSHFYSRLVHDEHFNKIDRLLKNAINEGAVVEYGANFDRSERFFQLTLLSDVSLNSEIMKEEIFGPLLPIFKYETMEEALAIIQSLPKPLGSYFFSTNQKNIDYFISNTTAGGTTINDIMQHFSHLGLPFGGVNTSGEGSENGHYGFLSFSHTRAVLKKPGPNLFAMLNDKKAHEIKKMFNAVAKIIKLLN